MSCGIALCTCNGAKFLRKQLDSIISQTVLPNEIVISDDCSDDGSWDILQKWVENIVKSHDIAVTLTQNTNRLGVVRNFEQACSRINAEVIFLCDQDDLWKNIKIERLLYEFLNPNVILAHSDADLIDGNFKNLGLTLFETLRFSKREKLLIKNNSFFEIYCRRNLVTGATTAFRRNLLSVAKPFPSDWLHDEWLAAIAVICGRVSMVPECLILYRQHDTNTVGAIKNLGDYLSHGVRRLRETSRNDFLKKRVRRLELWLARIESLDGEHIKEKLYIQEAIKHFQIRSQMEENQVSRFIGIWREWRSGRYERFSGWGRGVLRDFLNL